MAVPLPGRARPPVGRVPIILATLTLIAGSLIAPNGAARATESAPVGGPTEVGPAGASSRVDNPYAGAEVYVNPQWSAHAAAEPGGDTVADQPTAVWLDRIAAIEGWSGTMGLRDHLDAALDQHADLIQLTLYNLPGRDCDRRVSQGELSVEELDRYRTEYIDPIATILADPAYAGLRIVAIVEPNSLPNLITHTSPRAVATFGCDEARARGTYREGIGYALARLGAIANVYAYLDISHHGQLGWPDNAGPAAALFFDAANTAGSTAANVHGLIANTANYSALREEYFAADDVVNGQPVRQTCLGRLESLRRRTVLRAAHARPAD